jgi:AcrR family transcriptional regulator
MKKGQLTENRKTRYTKMVLRETLMEFMKTRPITDISIKEICAAADVSRTTFYSHYSDQYDLLRQIEEDTIAVTTEAFNKYDFARSKIEALKMMEELLDYVRKNTNSIQVLLGEYGDSSFQKKFFAFYFSRVFDKISRVGKLIDTVNTGYHLAFVITSNIGLTQHWLKNNMDKSIQEMAEMIIDLTYVPIKNSISKPKPRN